MLCFIFTLRNQEKYIDLRDIRTRQRDGVVFKTIHVNHYMARQNPLFRAFNAGNDLPVRVRNAENKEVFKSLYMSTIVNLYKK